MAVAAGDKLTLHMKLDSGSNSNLSPEQVIASFFDLHWIRRQTVRCRGRENKDKL